MCDTSVIIIGSEARDIMHFVASVRPFFCLCVCNQGVYMENSADAGDWLFIVFYNLGKGLCQAHNYVVGNLFTSLQQKRVYTSLGSSYPQCVHQS